MIINDNLSLIANPCCSDTIHAGDIRNHPWVVRVRGVSSGECKHGRCVIGSLGEEYNISHLFVYGWPPHVGVVLRFCIASKENS